jgi:hypothetical protein
MKATAIGMVVAIAISAAIALFGGVGIIVRRGLHSAQGIIVQRGSSHSASGIIVETSTPPKMVITPPNGLVKVA